MYIITGMCSSSGSFFIKSSSHVFWFCQKCFCITLIISDSSTDTQGRSQTSYTAPCNGAVSHGAQIGGLWVFDDHTRKHKHKANRSTIFACCAAFYSCLSPGGGHSTFFSGRGVRPGFPKCGACELTFASEKGGL